MMTSDEGRKTRRKKEREKKAKGEKRRENARKAGQAYNTHHYLQLYNYNTFVHQADAINKWEKTRGPFSPTSLSQATII